MPIFMDSDPISTILGILGFSIFVSRDSGPWMLEFSGSDLKAITSKNSPLGVHNFQKRHPLDFKSKEGRDFHKIMHIIYCLS